MAEAQLRQFLDKVRQLNAFVAMSEADPRLRQELRDCEHHDQVVALARRCGFEIGRRWGEGPALNLQADASASPSDAGMSAGTGVQPELAASATDPCQGRAAGLVAMAGHSSGAPVADLDCGAGSLPASSGSRPSAEARPGAAGERPFRPCTQPQASGTLDGGEVLRSLLAGPCPPPGQEVTEVLLETPQWRLERIHSCACSSPDGFWYEQQEHEWVMLLQGTARLRCADQPSDLELRPGDSLWLRAGQRHRVTATDPAPGTIWLALFWRMA